MARVTVTLSRLVRGILASAPTSALRTTAPTLTIRARRTRIPPAPAAGGIASAAYASIAVAATAAIIATPAASTILRIGDTGLPMPGDELQVHQKWHDHQRQKH